MLTIKDVSFAYQKEHDIFQGLSAEFEKGKVYVLYGQSGCGKSTCLKLLGGLLRPQSGEIAIDGKDIFRLGENYRNQFVSLIFQDFCLFPYLNALENIGIALGIQKKNVQEIEIISYLEEFGIPMEDWYRAVSRLSGGQQQRIAIIRSLMMETDYILADEPTGNLDDENEQMIINEFCSLAGEYKKCAIVASHSENFAKAADELYQVKGKRLEKRG